MIHKQIAQIVQTQNSHYLHRDLKSLLQLLASEPELTVEEYIEKLEPVLVELIEETRRAANQEVESRARSQVRCQPWKYLG